MPDLRPVRGRPLLMLAMACLPAVCVFWMSGFFSAHPGGGAAGLYELAAGRGKLTVTAVGLISHRENTDSTVRLYVSDLTFIHEDTVYKDTSSKTLIYTDQAHPEAVPGNYLSCRGTLSLPEEATCPGQFDASAYMEASRVRSIIRNARIDQIYTRITLPGTLAKLRWRTGRVYERLFPQEEAGVMKAVTLGERGAVTSQTQDLYSSGGISHILAVSGTHIALAGMGIYRFLRKRRRSFLFSSAVSFAGVFSFAMMTGFGISAVRAVVMYSIWLAAQVSGKSYDAVQAALAAAAAVLAVSPMNVTQAGFWLSFGCVLSIHLAGPSLGNLFGKSKLAGTLGASLAVFGGTLPLVCRFFYQFSPFSLIINLPVILMMPVLMVLGILSVLAAPFSARAGVFLAGGCRMILRIFSLLCEGILKLPFGSIVTGCPSPAAMAASWGMFAVAVWLCADLRKNRVIKRIMAAALLVGMSAVLFRPQPAFEAVFLDVGQGDCTLVSAGDFHMMVDGGSSSDSDVWAHRISPALKYYGISRLDCVFVTHGDLDHYSGIGTSLETYASAPERIGIGFLAAGENISFDEDLKALARKAASQKIPVRSIHKGETLTAGEVKIRCLYPSAQQCEKLSELEDKNILSLVLEVSYRDVELLLTGDLESAGEEMMTASCREEWEKDSGNGRIRILKCGHHGSANATKEDLLRFFRPQAALISCGRGNRYGHPSPEVLQRLANAEVKIFRTDLAGTVSAVCRKGKVSMEVYTN